MSDKDIIERLRSETAQREVLTPLGELVNEAADVIAALRYDHERDVEKVAALSHQVEALERLCGVVTPGDGFREMTKDIPRRPVDLLAD